MIESTPLSPHKGKAEDSALKGGKEKSILMEEPKKAFHLG